MKGKKYQMIIMLVGVFCCEMYNKNKNLVKRFYVYCKME